MRLLHVFISKFHHLNIAIRLQERGVLDRCVTGSPKILLGDAVAQCRLRVESFPLFQAPLMVACRMGLGQGPVYDYYNHLAHKYLSEAASKFISDIDVVFGMSGSCLEVGKQLKARSGSTLVIERSSTHIGHQANLLRGEYERFGLKAKAVAQIMIDRELEEYEIADLISVPSAACIQSFVDSGVPSRKLLLNPFFSIQAKVQIILRNSNINYILIKAYACNLATELLYS